MMAPVIILQANSNLINLRSQMIQLNLVTLPADTFIGTIKNP